MDPLGQALAACGLQRYVGERQQILAGLLLVLRGRRGIRRPHDHIHRDILFLLAQQECPLPDYVQQKSEDYLRCGRLEHGLLRMHCDTCHAEHLVAFSCCLQQEIMRSPESGVRYLWHPPKDSLPIVSDRKARR